MLAQSPQPATPPVLSSRIVVSLLAVFAVLSVPLFVCAPVTSDTSLFDVQAMTVMKGGVLYRDVLEPNLPGIVWLHVLIRSVVGWSSEAMRVVDLTIFLTSIYVLQLVLRTLIKSDRDTIDNPTFALFVALFYLSRNEWCHCQRDMWMLLPVSLGLLLRVRRRASGGTSAVLEGMLWGVAFWIKPHVAIPALAGILVDVLRFEDWKKRIADVALVVAGGLVAAVPGIYWLIASGAWEHFWEMMLEWNPEYLATGRNRRSWERLSFMFQRFYPWWFVHCVAIPVAANQLYKLFSSNPPRCPMDHHDIIRRTALSAFYLAWLTQTFLIQHAMDYIHVPEVILGIAVLTAHPWRLPHPVRKVAIIGMLSLVSIGLPQLQHNRWKAWPLCFLEGSSSEVRSTLAQGNYPDWNAINAVKTFLGSQSVGDRDVTCLNVHSIHLHSELQVLPANRYSSITHPLTMYPTRYDQIMTAVINSRPRFVVVDESETAHPHQVLPQQFPRQYPLAFDNGRYKVYALNHGS